MDAPISSLVAAAERGEGDASEALFGALYGELHRVAKRELGRHGMPMTLGATSLLHAAYVDMAGREGARFPDRPRFMSYAARVMRGLIIDHARSRNALKRGGQFELTSLGTDAGSGAIPDHDVVLLTQVSDALEELAKVEAILAEVVDLKFFCGFSFEEIATMHDVSTRTVRRRWEKARLFLFRAMDQDLPQL